MSPSTEKAHLASVEVQDEPAGLNNSRASSFLVRKWFPTGNLAWRTIEWRGPGFGSGVFHRRLDRGIVQGGVYELVQEVYEVLFISDDEQKRTGNIEWRPIPILPPEPPQPEQIGMFLPTFDSPLLNRSSPQPEKSSQ